MSGTAVNGTDYVSLSGSATVPAGAAYVDVTVTPKDDTAGREPGNGNTHRVGGRGVPDGLDGEGHD